MTLDKPTSSLKLALARAYFGAGSPDKGGTLLKETLDSSLDPRVWNDAAYYLADNQVDLPDAQHYAEKAVKFTEDDMVQTRLDTLEPADFARIRDLATFWGTLGWVYYQEVEFLKAQNYLEAAWNLSRPVKLESTSQSLTISSGEKRWQITNVLWRRRCLIQHRRRPFWQIQAGD